MVVALLATSRDLHCQNPQVTVFSSHRQSISLVVGGMCVDVWVGGGNESVEKSPQKVQETSGLFGSNVLSQVFFLFFSFPPLLQGVTLDLPPTCLCTRG